jgi:hypothetical protein
MLSLQDSESRPKFFWPKIFSGLFWPTFFLATTLVHNKIISIRPSHYDHLNIRPSQYDHIITTISIYDHLKSTISSPPSQVHHLKSTISKQLSLVNNLFLTSIFSGQLFSGHYFSPPSQVKHLKSNISKQLSLVNNLKTTTQVNHLKSPIKVITAINS